VKRVEYNSVNDFATAFITAIDLIGRFGPHLREIVLLSLAVSLTAAICAFAIGAPLGTALAVYRFPGRSALIVVVNSLLGLPPVVVGLVVYLLLSRSGPLGSFGILFTPTAMIIRARHRTACDGAAAFNSSLGALCISADEKHGPSRSPFSSNKHNSTRSAFSEKIATLTPFPSQVAPRGCGLPGTKRTTEG
jgi:hypothetical protein